MTITWERDRGILHHGRALMTCTCLVRNELNGKRSKSDPVVRTEREDGSEGVPYFPRPFPLGTWHIVAVLPKDDPYLAPFFISTDAHQPVEEWTEVAGHYGKPTERVVEDYGYGLHCSTSLTTLGCGRIQMRSDLLILRAAILDAEKYGEETLLEVI